jgi:hypothetical protein
MTTRLVTSMILLAFLLVPAFAGAQGITDSLITAEVILDGMTHFDADQGLKDYTVDISETTTLPDNPEVNQREKTLYFMAPNVYLTTINDKPVVYTNDASFSLLLSLNDLKRDKDVVIDGISCFKVIRTPKDPEYKKYTETFYVAKDDYRRIRTERITSELHYDYILSQKDYNYSQYQDKGDTWTLVSSRHVVDLDRKGAKLMEQTEQYSNYRFNTGLTQSFFDNILKGYNVYPSEGS